MDYAADGGATVHFANTAEGLALGRKNREIDGVDSQPATDQVRGVGFSHLATIMYSQGHPSLAMLLSAPIKHNTCICLHSLFAQAVSSSCLVWWSCRL